MTDQFGVIRSVAYVFEDMDKAFKHWVAFLERGLFICLKILRWMIKNIVEEIRR